MDNVVPLFPPKEKQEDEHSDALKHLPETYWVCGCENFVFYLAATEDHSFELVCAGCGDKQRW